MVKWRGAVAPLFFAPPAVGERSRTTVGERGRITPRLRSGTAWYTSIQASTVGELAESSLGCTPAVAVVAVVPAVAERSRGPIAIRITRSPSAAEGSDKQNRKQYQQHNEERCANFHP